MASHLSLVPIVPYACCMPWELRDAWLEQIEPVHGGRCCFCQRDVAVPEPASGKNVACIYCGMDRGFVPIVEIEPYTT